MKSITSEFYNNNFKCARRRILFLLTVIGTIFLAACEGPQGIPGPQGPEGISGEAEVFELRNVNFVLNASNEYSIYQTLNPQILLPDSLLIYRLSGTIDSGTPIWQQIPRTLFLAQGELDYDFDFSKEDFTIYAGGNYDLTLTPNYLNNQTFRIVIIKGYLSNKVFSQNKQTQRQNIDLSDYNAVIQSYNINDSNIKVLN